MCILGEGKQELAVHHSQKKKHAKAGTGDSGPWTRPTSQQALNRAESAFPRPSCGRHPAATLGL